MKKALVIGVGLWLAIASVVAIVWSPTPTLRQVSGVYLIWFISNVLNWVFLAIMVAPCAISLRDLYSRDKRVREAFATDQMTFVGRDVFWLGYWGSFIALVVNTIAPFALFFYLPFWIAIGPVVLNTFILNGSAPFVRVWIYRAAKSQVSVA